MRTAGAVRRTGVPVSVLVALVSLVVSGCGALEMPARSTEGATVDVATAELKQLRAEAGIEPCAIGTGRSGDRPDALPAIELPCLGGGQSVNLSSLRGPLVITVWAQWCAPCRDELPIFEDLAAGGSVDVLGINYYDTQPGQALRLMQQLEVTFPSVADPGARLKESYPWLTGLPLLMMVDEDGAVAYSEFREVSTLDELEDLVQSELGVTP